MKKTRSKPVEFSCHAPEAKAVFVAGTFNNWKPDATPLHRHPPDGKWSVALPLAPGRHEYKFVVDGQWCCEPGAKDEPQDRPDCCPNPFGTMNRVLEVSQTIPTALDLTNPNGGSIRPRRPQQQTKKGKR